MGLTTAFLRAGIVFVFTVILPLGGNSVARANGVFVLLLDEGTIIAVGTTLAIITFIASYFSNKRPRIVSVFRIAASLIRAWYFLLFLAMVDKVSIPSINTEVQVQYMRGLSEVPVSLLATLNAIVTPGSQLSIPVLGDLILLAFGLDFVRSLLTWFETPTKVTQIKKRQLKLAEPENIPTSPEASKA